MEHSILYAPNILRETHGGISFIPLQDEMLSNREVMVIGEITADLVNSLIAQFLHLKKSDPQGEIVVYINSPGGEVTSGLALYDVMQAVPCQTHTVCTGVAASMASVLFAAGDTRSMLPHSRLMLHDPLVPSTGGSALKLNEVAEDLMRIRESMGLIYSKHTGKTLEEIYEVTSKDTFFTPEAAIAFGLADEVVRTL